MSRATALDRHGATVLRKIRQSNRDTLVKTKHKPLWRLNHSRDQPWESLHRQWAEYGRQMAIKAGIIPDDPSIKAFYTPANINDDRHLVHFYAGDDYTRLRGTWRRGECVGEWEIPHRVYLFNPDHTPEEIVE